MLVQRMFKRLEEPGVFKIALLSVFLICFTYWGYLLFASQMSMAYDSIGYEGLGSMLYKKGWAEFFRTGPHREPLYPLTIAVSMRIADIFSISYHFIQKFIQIIFLFSSQLLLLAILNRLKVKGIIKLGALLYFGLSPAIVNTAFCLLSEIVVFPFIPAMVIFGLLSWQAIYNSRLFKRILILASATSVLLALATFGKGVFQYLFLFFLIPYFCILIRSIIRRDKAVLLRSLVYVAAMLLVFNSFIIPYKLMNKKFNKQFTLTDRYDYLLMKNALKRTRPLTKRILLTHLASIPGEGFCLLFFSEKECQDAQFYGADRILANLPRQVLDKIPPDDDKSKKVLFAVRTALGHPLKYILFMGIEAARMPFWESTQLAFVSYPKWLQRLFIFGPFKNSLRLGVAFLTYLSLFSITVRIFKNRTMLFNPQPENGESLVILLLIVLIIFSYTGLYSLFSILARFSLPIAPLYVICIAYFLNSKFAGK